MASEHAAARIITLEDAAARLGRCRSPLVLMHRNPDGDSVGSATALAMGLAARGAHATVVSPDPLPDYLLAIPGAAAIATSMEGLAPDLFVCVDVSDPALLAPLPPHAPGYLAARPSLNVDHHLSNRHYAQANYVDTRAASTAEIVDALLGLLGVTRTVDIATSLLYGIVNDTHSFQNTNTTPATLRLAADLVEAGADLNAITYNLLLARRPAAARLWARVLPTLRFVDAERVAMLTVSLEALASAGAEMSDADGLVEFLRSIRGVDLAVLFKQTAPEYFRLSLRTTEHVDATVIAGRFGGGGHRQAAGCDATGDLATIEQQVFAAYRAARGDALG